MKQKIRGEHSRRRAREKETIVHCCGPELAVAVSCTRAPDGRVLVLLDSCELPEGTVSVCPHRSRLCHVQVAASHKLSRQLSTQNFSRRSSSASHTSAHPGSAPATLSTVSTISTFTQTCRICGRKRHCEWSVLFTTDVFGICGRPWGKALPQSCRNRRMPTAKS